VSTHTGFNEGRLILSDAHVIAYVRRQTRRAILCCIFQCQQFQPLENPRDAFCGKKGKQIHEMIDSWLNLGQNPWEYVALFVAAGKKPMKQGAGSGAT